MSGDGVSTGRPRQPLLHDSVILLRAPSQAWSAASGDMGERGIHGFYSGDVRILRDVELRVCGEPLEAIAYAPDNASVAVFTGLARGVDDSGADPRIRVERRRSVQAGGLQEQVRFVNGTGEQFSGTAAVRVVADFTPMQLIKAGRVTEDAARFGRDGDDVIITAGGVRAAISAPGAQLQVRDRAVVITWPLEVPAHQASTVDWRVAVTDDAAVVAGATGAAPWAGVRARTSDSRLEHWVRAALDDLDALRMTTVADPGEEFLAAGAPWFFTLFGRDSIWAARLLLPLGTATAASTLRVLASLQGSRTDVDTAEQPGKIMHELRSATLDLGGGVALPPLYYGTVDATALWVCLLHDTWRAGLPDAEVEPLLPHLEAALGWMRDHGDADGDGFCEYIDSSGHGLVNQGWKDSHDGVQWRDGRLAEGPIALCEVQGYAYEAAIGGAAVLDHFGRDGGPWRDWAADLKRRFADAFWIDDPDGAYPAIALDATKQRVDTVTSNMGHLLGTGILQPGQAELIARRLVSEQLNSGFGLRTMSTDSAGYWPLSYHGGSVWAHDTAIVIAGLTREGLAEQAAELAAGLLRAADGFDYRMPELHAGDPASSTSQPVPYPAACRPQAWSAAAAISVATALGVPLDRDQSG